MVSAQWIIIALTALAAGLASFLYNDGRDRHLGLMLRAEVVIGAVGSALFFLSGALEGPASSLPECDWSNLDENLRPTCEKVEEAIRRAGEESKARLISDYIMGPIVEFGATTVGALTGFFAALVTRRQPIDGRVRQVSVGPD